MVAVQGPCSLRMVTNLAKSEGEALTRSVMAATSLEAFSRGVDVGCITMSWTATGMRKDENSSWLITKGSEVNVSVS